MEAVTWANPRRRPSVLLWILKSIFAPQHTETGSLSSADVQRLLDSVHQEIAGFSRQLTAVVDRPAQAESSGYHVQGTAERGHFTSLTVDPSWAGQIRHTEIESELTEVLRKLHNESTPGELAAGPQGPPSRS